jgi:hypothetical protein
MLTLVTWSLVLAAVGATPAGPCDLVDRATATQILGAPVTKVEPSGPEPDEDTGATRTTCTYYAGQSLFVVLRLDFPSAAAARDMVATELDPGKLTAEKSTVKEESGIGDKDYVVNAPRAIQYVVVKGPTVLTLILGGTSDPLPAHESQLRSAAGAATKRL